MALHSIPASWTAPASCFASTNYYRVLLPSGYFSNMYGTPTPVLAGITPKGNCFPPSFTINIPYLTDGRCPTGYTLACATAGPESRGEPVSTLTCCPSVTGDAFSFMCKDNEYGCHGTATPGAVWTGVITDIGLATPTERPVTRTPSPDEGLEAWGIKLLSVAPASTPTHATTASQETASSTASSTTNRDTVGLRSGEASKINEPPKQSGSPTGSIVGISVGSTLAVVLLALGAFLLYRHSRRRQSQNTPPPGSNTDAWQEQKSMYQLSTHGEPQLLDAQDPRRVARPAWELPS